MEAGEVTAKPFSPETLGAHWAEIERISRCAAGGSHE